MITVHSVTCNNSSDYDNIQYNRVGELYATKSQPQLIGGLRYISRTNRHCQMSSLLRENRQLLARQWLPLAVVGRCELSLHQIQCLLPGTYVKCSNKTSGGLQHGYRHLIPLVSGTMPLTESMDRLFKTVNVIMFESCNIKCNEIYSQMK